jgi:hypothetical protein
MDFVNQDKYTQLARQIQTLQDQLVAFKRSYEDLINNLDSDNMPTVWRTIQRNGLAISSISSSVSEQGAQIELLNQWKGLTDEAISGLELTVGSHGSTLAGIAHWQGEVNSELEGFGEDINGLQSATAELALEASALGAKIGLLVDVDDKVKAGVIVDAINGQSSANIYADRINFVGKTFNLTTENININSTNFSVTPTGVLTVKTGNIGGFILHDNIFESSPEATIEQPEDGHFRADLWYDSVFGTVDIVNYGVGGTTWYNYVYKLSANVTYQATTNNANSEFFVLQEKPESNGVYDVYGYAKQSSYTVTGSSTKRYLIINVPNSTTTRLVTYVSPNSLILDVADGNVISRSSMYELRMHAGRYIARYNPNTTSNVYGMMFTPDGIKFTPDGGGTVTGGVYFNADSGGELISVGIGLSYSPQIRIHRVSGDARVTFSCDAYTKNDTIIISDRNKKKDIIPLYDSRYDIFFDSLKPSLFRYKENESNRLHCGFIAQDVEEALLKAGIDTSEYAVLCKWYDKHGNLEYGLREKELIALMVNQVQKLKNRVTALEALHDNRDT